MKKGEIKFNKRTNTLEEEYYRYELQDVKEPNLFREIYSYSDLPKIVFNHRIVPMNPPDDIWITDTTFRDGQQSLPPFTVKQILDLYDMMHRLGGPNGLIRQCEFFLYSDKDKEAVSKCLERDYTYPNVTGWIRPVKEDFKLVKDMGLKETGILTSASDYHIFLKLKKTRKQAMDMYLGIVKSALDIGIIPRCHLEDITRADFYGFVVPFVQELMELSKEANIPIKIRACDTLGYGVTYPGVALPRSVKGIIYGLINLAEVPPEQLEWHGHNDFYHGLSNATTSWLYGCCAVNGAILGIGERTGNTPVEALVMEYLAFRGAKDGVDTTVITDMAEYFEKEIGYNIPDNQPFVGRNFNVTSAGIHADGLMKDEEIYNIFDTDKLLKKKVDIAINDKSGVAGIAKWISINLNIEKNKAITKDSPGVVRIREWVDSEYARGRTTAISSKELKKKTKEFLPELFK
ncbi:MAG: 2-isopropylmalate synthase [Candidatus Omnitrophota bacterium]